MKCDKCNSPKVIKDSLGCNADRLHNAFEDFKHEICKLAKKEYEPNYQCRFADLIESERSTNEIQ